MPYSKITLLFLVWIPLFSIAQNDMPTIDVHLQKVRQMVDSTQYEEALDFSKQIYSDYNQLSSKNDTILTEVLNSISEIFIRMAKPDSAIFYSRKALGILDDSGLNHFQKSQSYNNLGKSYYQLGRFNEAIEAFEKGLEIVQLIHGEDHFEATSFYGNMSLCFTQIGQPKKAISVLEKNLEILNATHGENHIHVAKTYNNLGAAYYNIGDYDKTLDLSFKTLELKKSLLGENHPSIGSTYINIGSMYSEKGDFDKSKSYVEKGKNILLDKFGENHPYLTFGYKVLGDTYKQLGDYSKAIEQFEKGIQIIQNNYGPKHYRVGGFYVELGDLYRKLKNFGKAEKYASKALNTFLNNNVIINKDAIVCYELLGSIYYSKGDLDKAIDNYKTALNYYNDQKLRGPDRAVPLLNIGKLYTLKNDFENAKYFFDQCENSINYSSDDPTFFNEVTSIVSLRKLLAQKRNYYQKIYQLTGKSNYNDSILLNDQHAIALEDYYQIELSDQEAQTFHFENALWRYEAAIEHLLNQQSSVHIEKAFQVVEKSKGRFLAESFRSVEAKKVARISDSLLKEEKQLDIDLAYLEKKLFQERFERTITNDTLIKAYKNEVFEIKRQKEKLIDIFKKNYPSYHKLKYDQSVPNIIDIQSKLDSNHAFIEYFDGDSSIFVFVITSESADVKIIKKDFPLDEWVKAFRESIFGFWIQPGQSDQKYDENMAAYREYGFQLYKKLIHPIEKLLPEKLTIVSDGSINFIPFEALISEMPEEETAIKNYDYLVKKYQISHNYSASLFLELLRQEKKEGDIPLLAFAPTFNESISEKSSLLQIRSGLKRLNYNIPEARAVHKILGGDLYLGDDATEAQFLKSADKYRVIHLSTHGKSNDKMGDYSFVSFSEIPDSITDNERLYVRELYNMQLNADMVVVSACETGLGEIKRGEGIIGLARGFTFAGAASTVTSLWNVNDIQTSNLMARFYSNIKSGMTKDAALRHAKLSYLAEENHPDPYFWSAFIAAGNMSPIDFNESKPWWYFGLLALGLFAMGILKLNSQKLKNDS